MAKLAIYYSDTGNCALAAEKLRERGFDLRRAQPEKELSKSFVLKILQGGFLSGLGKKSKLKDFNADLQGYDEIAVLSPVWNGRTACPINTVLADCDFAGKTLRFILCAGGGSAPKAEKLLKERFPDASVLVLKEPKKYPEELEKLETVL